jgi:hypothetical protein
LATLNLGRSEPWNFDAIVDAISPSPEPKEGSWILSGANTPASSLSRIPMGLIDPELREALPSFTPNLPATADSLEDTHEKLLLNLA